MKIIENNWNQSKEVVYKGNTLIVPIWTNWVIVNSNGEIVAFRSKPHVGQALWYGLGDMLMIGKVEFEENEDWKQSLEYVGE